MPPRGFQKPEPLDQRLKVNLTAAEYLAVAGRADAAGLTISGYVRQLIAIDLGQTAKVPKHRTERHTLELLAEVHMLAMQVKRIGVNVNQMTRQANTGMVPLSVSELRVMQSQIANAMERAVVLFDKVLKR
ncbi:MAG: MobC family plasmid mobilization relaxosome protein [Alphaproteobacteria bacterium]|nr:MobC family plasmid mobilization relaxosome protein [Alphaproteobacteria bacterium]